MARKQRDAEATDTFVSPHPTPPPGPELVVFHGGEARVLPLPPNGELVIGRSPECDVVIDHKTVSRRHAKIVLGRGAAIEDLGSFNGTLLGSWRLEPRERVPLTPGQPVTIGNAAIVYRPVLDPSEVANGARSSRPDRDAMATLPPPAPESTSSMARVERLLRLVARGDISVLLLGETGVGKELAAETVHESSSRANGPFVRINCAALPENLLEAELFGYERGAFTGADRPKIGLLESASGGTVFLDEIGELPLTTQAKLLRALERREVLPIGAVQPRAIDVRFVSATNRDIGSELGQKSFRRDLYYRLNGVEIRIPALRERARDLLPFARGFLEDACQRLGLPEVRLSPAAEQRIVRHAWPGNIRELKNAIDRAALLCEGHDVEPEHLCLDEATEQRPAYGGDDDDLRSSVARYERQRISEALERTGGNQTEAARLLGIPRRTLVHKLREHGITRRS